MTQKSPRLPSEPRERPVKKILSSILVRIWLLLLTSLVTLAPGLPGGWHRVGSEARGFVNLTRAAEKSPNGTPYQQPHRLPWHPRA